MEPRPLLIRSQVERILSAGRPGRPPACGNHGAIHRVPGGDVQGLQMAGRINGYMRF